MPHFTGRLFDETRYAPALPWFEDAGLVYFYAEQPLEQKLNALSLKVSRKPKDLIGHLRRIYFCHQHALHEPLYAALLDWLIVLNGKGQKMSLRLLQGCKGRLDPAEFLIFREALDNVQTLPGNRYSLFTQGLSGSTRLLAIEQTTVPQADCLQLAQDFIEFSQLDEAIAVLEQGLDEQPGRAELQAAVLELYLATEDWERFHKRFRMLQDAGIEPAVGWQQLNNRLGGENHG